MVMKAIKSNQLLETIKRNSPQKYNSSDNGLYNMLKGPNSNNNI